MIGQIKRFEKLSPYLILEIVKPEKGKRKINVFCQHQIHWKSAANIFNFSGYHTNVQSHHPLFCVPLFLNILSLKWSETGTNDNQLEYHIIEDQSKCF